MGKGREAGDLRQRAAPCLSRLLEKGLLAIPAGQNVIRLLPPLVITDEELDRGVSILKEALAG